MASLWEILAKMNPSAEAAISMPRQLNGPPTELMAPQDELNNQLVPTTQMPLNGQQAVGQAHAAPANFSQSSSVGVSYRGPQEKLDYAKQLDDAFYNEMQKRQGQVGDMQSQIKTLQGQAPSFADVNLKPLLAFADTLNNTNTAATYGAPTGVQQRKSDVQRLQEAVMKQQNAIGDDQLAYLKQKASEESQELQHRRMLAQLSGSGDKGEERLRKEFNSHRTVKTYGDVMEAAKAIYANPSDSGPAQQALITQYAKILDPGSVVRETEFAITANNAGALNRVMQTWEKIKTGQSVTEDQVRDMKKTVKDLVSAYENSYKRTADYYQGLATQKGYRPDNVVFNHYGQLNGPQQPQAVMSFEEWKASQKR